MGCSTSKSVEEMGSHEAQRGPNRRLPGACRRHRSATLPVALLYRRSGAPNAGATCSKRAPHRRTTCISLELPLGGPLRLAASPLLGRGTLGSKHLFLAASTSSWQQAPLLGREVLHPSSTDTERCSSRLISVKLVSKGSTSSTSSLSFFSSAGTLCYGLRSDRRC